VADLNPELTMFDHDPRGPALRRLATRASLAAYFGVRYAERQPDRGHHFGRGKGEAVTGFTQVTFLTGAALVLPFHSTQRLVFPL
jgi:ferrous-iron efflux pump FieF